LKTEPPHPPQHRILDIKKILDKTVIPIKGEKDIENFLSSLKNKLKEELDSLDEKGYIDLRF
jgi:hypothetical protein